MTVFLLAENGEVFEVSSRVLNESPAMFKELADNITSNKEEKEKSP